MSIKPFAEQGHYTAVHDAIFDEVMPVCPPNAWKVLCYIVRKTRGWNKDEDALPYSQILEGTGISSKATLSNSLKWLVEKNLIIRDGGRDAKGKQRTAKYRLNHDYELNSGSEIEPEPSTEIEPGVGTETKPGPGTEIEPFNNHRVPQEPKSKNQSTSVEKDSLQSSFSTRRIANSEEQTGEQEGESLPEAPRPAKAMTALTVERCTEVGFDPAPHQKINWGSGWSKYLYVASEADMDPPEPEEAYAVLSEIVAAAAGQRGKGRYWLSVQDAVKRIRDDGTAIGGRDRDKERRRRGGSAIWLTQEDLEKPDLYAGRI